MHVYKLSSLYNIVQKFNFKCLNASMIIPDKRLDCKCDATRCTLLKIRGKHPVVTKFAVSYKTGQNVCQILEIRPQGPCLKGRKVLRVPPRHSPRIIYFHNAIYPVPKRNYPFAQMKF